MPLPQCPATLTRPQPARLGPSPKPHSAGMHAPCPTQRRSLAARPPRHRCPAEPHPTPSPSVLGPVAIPRSPRKAAKPPTSDQLAAATACCCPCMPPVLLHVQLPGPRYTFAPVASPQTGFAANLGSTVAKARPGTAAWPQEPPATVEVSHRRAETIEHPGAPPNLEPLQLFESTSAADKALSGTQIEVQRLPVQCPPAHPTSLMAAGAPVLSPSAQRTLGEIGFRADSHAEPRWVA
mmetsp:Transcript_45792/g.121458  ORF Transcript_45792/g.121458 Transcript_45792/m.121458 type:complete len:237 (+) Transcript_45792:1563-2273(+)